MLTNRRLADLVRIRKKLKIFDWYEINEIRAVKEYDYVENIGMRYPINVFN